LRPEAAPGYLSGDMSNQPLKTAILGLKEPGRLLAEQTSKLDYFNIRAVADKDTALAETTAAKYNCSGFDDYRRLIIQNELDCLLVTAALHSCDEYLRMAMKKKINILKLAPAGHHFEQTAGFTRLAENEGVKYAVAHPERFGSHYLALREFLRQKRVEKVFLISAACNFSDREHPPWQSSPELAGGGVLLHNCYEITDQIIWNFGLPQQVYSVNTNRAQDRQQRISSTEDTAVVTMKFDDGLIGNIIASRLTNIGPQEILLKVYGKDRILTVNNNRFIISDERGKIDEQHDCRQSWQEKLSFVLENFALSILSPDENRLCVDSAQVLKNMAVIEAAYLSTRTGFPEGPERILQMAAAAEHTAQI